MMIRWGRDADERAWFPLDAAADYWEARTDQTTVESLRERAGTMP
jgi:hypothetical protein